MDLNTLKKSLCNIVELKDCMVTLIEDKNKGKAGTLERVYIKEIPENSICFKIEKTRFNNLLKAEGIWHFNKHSDYIIANNEDIVFIEMKSTDVNEEKCISKFKGDLCALKYSDSIFEIICKKNKFFEGKKRHYNVLYYVPINLTTSQINSPANAEPMTFRKIGTQNDCVINFNRLL